MIRSILAVVIYAAMYVLASARSARFVPLGRTAVTLAGAALMVVAGILTPAEAYAGIDGDTIVLLLGMMILTEHLKAAGFFELVATWLFRVAKTPNALLTWLVFASGVLSSLLVNDTVCLMMAPLVVTLIARAGQPTLPRFPYLMAVATSANVGSVMTLVGSPQNMIVGSLAKRGADLDFIGFAAHMIPVGAVCLALHAALLRAVFRHDLKGAFARPPTMPPFEIHKPLLYKTLAVLAVVTALFLAGMSPAWTTLAGASLLFVVRAFWRSADTPTPAQILRRVDWSVLLFFIGLFVCVRGFAASGVPTRVWAAVSHLWEPIAHPILTRVHFVWITVVGSNLVSNVPFIALIEEEMSRFPNAKEMWMLLALASTFAGNLTLLGSVANVIVFESAKEKIGFWQYTRIGLPATILSCVVGTGLLALLAHLY